MKRFVPFFLLIFFFSACKLNNANDTFQITYDEYLENRIQLLPELRFEEKNFAFQIPTIERFQKASSYFNRMSFDLNDINMDNLNEENKNLMATLKYDVQNCVNLLKDTAFTWDPSFYNVGGILKQKLNNPNVPNLCERMEAVHKDFEAIPSYYETAKSNLTNPSIQKTLLAIEKNSLGFKFLKSELMDSLNSTTCTPFDKAEFTKKMDNTLIAIKDYVAFCNSLKFEYGEKKSEVVFRDSL